MPKCLVSKLSYAKINNLLPDQQVTHFQQDDSELRIEINLFQREINLASLMVSPRLPTLAMKLHKPLIVVDYFSLKNRADLDNLALNGN